MKPVFALVDCNNFYASCERVFAPALERKPVAVLSNNDGVVIARSNETKRLGIPMGAPVFKYKKIISRNKVALFSSNFALYGDLSNRVMSVLADLAPNIEVYSIDEAFLQLDGIDLNELEKFGSKVRSRVRKWTGIPVSVGIANSKTLAKAANEIAKKNMQFRGVLNLVEKKDLGSLLASLPVGDIWGIGRQYSKWLLKNGIRNARDLMNADRRWIIGRMGINGQRLLNELGGQSCISLEPKSSAKKQIISSRSFHEPVEERGEVERAIGLYAARAAEKLRTQKSVAGEVAVFVATSRFGSSKRYFNSARYKFNSPTAFTPEIVKAAVELLDGIFLEGYRYKKTGVMLSSIVSDKTLQTSFFEKGFYNVKKKSLMEAIDAVNSRWGSHTIALARSGNEQTWMMKQTKRSKRHTTRWDELLIVPA